MGVIAALLPIVGTMAVGLLIVVGIILLARANGGTPPASPALATGEGWWYAQVSRPGLSLDAMLSRVGGWGILRVGAGQVSFTRDHEGAPEWSLPATELAVSGPGMGPDFRLEHPQLGDVQVRVSTSKGARWREAGDIRNVGDRRVAGEVVRVILGWGAALR